MNQPILYICLGCDKTGLTESQLTSFSRLHRSGYCHDCATDKGIVHKTQPTKTVEGLSTTETP